MVGSCHRKPSTAIPPKFQSFIAVFFSGVIPPKAMTLSLITPSFPALVSCSGENAERYTFRYAVEDGAQKQIVISLSVRQFLDGMARAG